LRVGFAKITLLSRKGGERGAKKSGSENREARLADPPGAGE